MSYYKLLPGFTHYLPGGVQMEEGEVIEISDARIGSVGDRFQKVEGYEPPEIPEPDNNDDGAGGGGESVEGGEEAEGEDTYDRAHDEWLFIAEESVSAAATIVRGADNLEDLEAIQHSEVANKNRRGVLRAIYKRHDELAEILPGD